MKPFQIAKLFKKDLQEHQKSLCLFVILLSVSLHSCSSTKEEDPLKNSKRVIANGHKSLYYNGAFEVPGTSLKFIPPFAEAEIYIYGQRVQLAKEAFVDNWKRARESYVVLKTGTSYSKEVSKFMAALGFEAAKKIHHSITKPGIVLLVDSKNSVRDLPKEVLVSSYENYDDVRIASEKFRKDLLEEGEKIEKMPDPFPAGDPKRFRVIKGKLFNDVNKFLIGYADLGKSFSKESEKFSENFSDISFSKSFESLSGQAKQDNMKLFKILQEEMVSYPENVSSGFKDAGDEFKKVETGAGLSLAIVKSFYSITKSVFYDAILKPVGITTIGSIGFIGMNGFIYPVSFVGVGGYNSVRVLVEVLDYSKNGVIHLIAPTAELALSALLRSSEVVFNESKLAFDRTAYLSELSSRKSLGTTTKGTAILSETGGKYILAPIAGIVTGISKTVVGSGTSLSKAGAGTFAIASGSSASAGTLVASSATVGTTFATGVAASGITSLGFGVYYTAKAIGVPTGIAVGSGVVMNYEMISQLSAHTILGVSDFSYLVLSQEGGNWVVYAVRDTSKKAGSLLTGAVVDLDKVRKEGGEIAKVPVSREEMEKVLKKKKQ